MKKLFLLILLVAGLGTLRADEPLQLVLRTTAGVERSFLAAGLQATVADGNLSLTNGTDSGQYPLTSLDRMWFKGGSLSVGEIPMEEAVEVTSLQGIGMGTFATVREACSQLPAGIYVFKSKSATFKISVK